MNQKNIMTIFLLIIATMMSCFFVIQMYHYIQFKTADIEVELKNNLQVEVYQKKKVSDFIQTINGTILDDRLLDTTKLGKKNVIFHYKNDDGIKVPYLFQIEIVDTTEPLVWLGSHYSVPKGAKENITKKILCGDNYDSTPDCRIEGNFDVNQVGNYNVTFKATDESGNETVHPFILNVYDPEQKEKSEQIPTNQVIAFSDVIKKYKTKNTKIGIDVSSWQGDIDFEKLQKAGVEFVMLRVGSYTGEEEKYFVDKKFIQNIENANKYDIDVGIYFYSYATSEKEAKEDAKWVIDQVKDYKIQLPIAYDWEDWNYFNDYQLSFFGLTSMAEAFLEEVEKHGYEGMLYSSKTYLENIWFPTKYDVWLAHYVDQTNYSGKYKMWQLTDKGTIDGIKGTVDINVMYS